MLKFALVGCGRIAKRHADLLGENQIAKAKLVAVADTKIERAQIIGEAKNVPAFSDMHEMMTKEKPDVVSVLTRERHARAACYRSCSLWC